MSRLFLRPRLLRQSRMPFFEENKPARSIISFVVILLISHSLSRFWVFEYPGLLSMEILQRAISPVRAEYARIIQIDSKDYRAYFHECLSAKDIGAAIDRIFEFGPALLVVDLDTSADRFHDLRDHDNTRIVWARDADEADFGGEVRFDPLPILGGLDYAPKNWGLALFPRSLDWTVRTYRRTYPVGTQQRPALHWATVVAFCATPAGAGVAGCESADHVAAKLRADDSSASELKVPIRHAQYSFPPIFLRDVMPPDISEQTPPAAERSLLTGKVVILGGSYSPGDKHSTALGVLNGVEVVASAVEAELNPRDPQEPSLASEVIIDAILSLLVVVFYYFLRPYWALAGSLVLVAFLFFFGSLVAAIADYRMSSISFTLGILIEQMTRGVDARDELHQTQEKLRLLKAQMRTP
jgi:hypothetical protein